MSEERNIHAEELVWRGVTIEVRYEPDWLDGYLAHLELESTLPERAPLPVTKTGYRSLFVAAEAVDASDGPVAYAEAWLNAEALASDWLEREAAARQLSLF